MKNELLNLLSDVALAYEKSDIKGYCEEHGHEWFYSLVTTTMETGHPLILGFNWGASGGEKYSPQATIENSPFRKQDAGSLSRIFPFCEKYFGTEFLSSASQSNYCFFRSQQEREISKSDIELCEPIFDKLINTLAPSIVLCFSSKLRDYLIDNEKVTSIQQKQVTFKRGKGVVTYYAKKAILISGAEIVFLPHPMYQIKAEVRTRAWEILEKRAGCSTL